MPIDDQESTEERLVAIGERLRASAIGVRNIRRDSVRIYEDMTDTAAFLYLQYMTWCQIEAVAGREGGIVAAATPDRSNVLRFLGGIIYAEDPQASIAYSDRRTRASELRARIEALGLDLATYESIARWWANVGNGLTRGE